VAKTLLAVDDSVTMRKVLEITFGGDDFNVVTAETRQDALGKSGDASVCVIDTSLGNEDGYALAKEIRQRNAAAAIILLASRHNPYDQAKGKDAGADDFMDKPFDTQQMIDKVRKVMVAKEGGAGEAKPAAAAAAPQVKVPAAAAGANVGAVPPIQQRGTQPSVGGAAAQATGSRQRAATLMFGGEGGPNPADVVRQAIAQAEASPKPPAAAEKRHPTPVPPATVAATPAAMHGINGQLAGQLEGLGLTKAQADAVLALSREVVERVVWEVVPVVAEALIKEEIARLTKEG
jgi:CheY-like chemotaxis protein